MSNCIEKIKCHNCGSNSLQVFQADDGSYNGFCFGSCGRYEDNPYRDKPVGHKPTIKKKTDEEVEEEIADIKQCGFHELKERKLGVKALERFGIRIGLSTQDGKTPIMHYYPKEKNGKVVAYKARVIASKKMWGVGSAKGCDLFGWQQAVEANGKRLYITEGELDAASVFTIIKRSQKGEYKENDPSVVSLPDGAGCAEKVIAANLDKIRKNFKEVVLVFDDDEAGKEATTKVLKIAPDFLVATLPCKDANECLVKGHIKAAFNSLMFKASKPKNTRLVWGEEVHEAAKEQAEFGVSWPWPAVTDITRGIRTKETIYIGAAQKMG